MTELTQSTLMAKRKRQLPSKPVGRMTVVSWKASSWRFDASQDNLIAIRGVVGKETRRRRASGITILVNKSGVIDASGADNSYRAGSIARAVSYLAFYVHHLFPLAPL